MGCAHNLRQLEFFLIVTIRSKIQTDQLPHSQAVSPKPRTRVKMDSIFTNKYAEGYPGKRYYGGCEVADKVEQLAIDRAKELFGAEHANVQAHSGTSANVAVYMSTLKPGDTVLGMNLAHGGHLTHGHPLNFPGRMYKFVAPGVRPPHERT